MFNREFKQKINIILKKKIRENEVIIIGDYVIGVMWVSSSREENVNGGWVNDISRRYSEKRSIRVWLRLGANDNNT